MITLKKLYKVFKIFKSRSFTLIQMLSELIISNNGKQSKTYIKSIPTFN